VAQVILLSITRILEMLFTIIITTENTCTNCKMTALVFADLNLLICILPKYDKKSGCIAQLSGKGSDYTATAH